MEELEVSAKTVEEAVQDALEQLGLTREEVEVIVLNEGKSGILGLGAQEAKVRVRPITRPAEESEIAQRAREVIQTVLEKMGVTASIESYPAEPSTDEEIAPITFDIKSDDSGILIGRRGQTISHLQYIINLIIAHQIKAWVPISIDVEGYRQRRREALQALAIRVAERVKTSQRPFTLEPMPAYDRRIIHLALADHPDVTTESTGEGESRKVVIIPKNQF